MRSQESFTLVQSAREIQVAIKADGERVGGLLNEQHPLPVEEGEPAFDYRRHMRHLSHQLSEAVDVVVVAEDAHADQQIQSSRAQEERDEVAARGYGKLVSARQGLEGLYERGGFELTFISGATPQAPKRLVEQLGQSAKLLRRPAVERRSLKVRGFSVNFDDLAVDLESEEKDLRAALDRVDAVQKSTEGTLLVRRGTLDVLRRTVIWVGRTVEGLFHLADEDELAARIRSSTRRPPRPSERTGDEPVSDDSPDSGGADSGEPDSSVPDPPASDGA